MKPYTLLDGFAPAKSGNQQQSPLSKLMHTPEPNNGKRSFDHKQSPDLNIQLSNTKRRKDEAMVAANGRASELKKAIPPVKGKAELLPTAFLKDPMRAASAFQRSLRTKRHDYLRYKLLTSKRSRIADINLEAFLKDNKVWNSLSIKQQQALVERSGIQYRADIESYENGKLPNIWKMMDQRQYKYMQLETVVDKFQSELRGGILDPEWRADARRAGMRRSRGDFVRDDVEEEEESSSSESSDESSDYSSEIEDMNIDGDDPEATVGKKVPGKLKIVVHED